MNGMSVNQWKELFAEIGLSEENMQKWHHLFEKRHPQAHQGFLEWLGLDDARIKEIRQESLNA